LLIVLRIKDVVQLVVLLARMPVALQLWSVREDCARDLEGTLGAVAEMGYDGVEFAGYHGWSARRLRDLLRDLGLRVAGSHVGIGTLIGDELEGSIEFNQELGNRFLIVPALPVNMMGTKEAWLDVAGILNVVAERLGPEGMRTGYHNHQVEFQGIGGELPWDIVMGSTVGDVVMQFDVGNAMLGGVSVEEVFGFMRCYPGRARTVHLKEYSSVDGDALLGEGETPLREFMGLCESVGGTEWFIVEQGAYPVPPLESARRCRENLEELLV
jgi:sugar phosphate isomerase/epimerase